MKARVANEDGMTLIELLIAMVVLAIGISAIVAGYSSGLFAINRADKATSAAALADQQMEACRQSTYNLISTTAVANSVCYTKSSTVVGNDTRTYGLSTTVQSKCVDGTTPSPGCSTGEAVKLVTVVVREDSSTGHILITENSTFDQLAG